MDASPDWSTTSLAVIKGQNASSISTCVNAETGHPEYMEYKKFFRHSGSEFCSTFLMVIQDSLADVNGFTVLSHEPYSHRQLYRHQVCRAQP